jgi:hypothetical protein
MAVYPAGSGLEIFAHPLRICQTVNVRYETREKISSSEIFMQENVRVEHLIN